MGVHRNIDANFLRGVMPKVPSKKHPYENFGMPYVFLWILHALLEPTLHLRMEAVRLACAAHARK